MLAPSEEPDVTALAALAARPIGCFKKPDVTRFGRGCSPDGCSPARMLLGTGHDQVGSDGCSPADTCSPHRKLLGAGRDQAHRMLLKPDMTGWMLAPSDAS